jgi:hypothetical protein
VHVTLYAISVVVLWLFITLSCASGVVRAFAGDVDHDHAAAAAAAAAAASVICHNERNNRNRTHSAAGCSPPQQNRPTHPRTENVC